MTHSWLWGSILVVVALVITWFVFMKMSDSAVNRWAREKLVPRAKRDDIDLTMFVQLLMVLEESEQELEDEISSMVTSVGDICEALFEMGEISPEE